MICLCRMSNVYISKRNERMFQIVLENVLLYVFIDPELSRFLQTLFSDTSSELFKIYLETFERNTSKTCFKTLLNSQNFTYLLEKSCKRIQNKSDFFQLWSLSPEIQCIILKKKTFPAGLASYHRSDLSKWKSYFLSEKLNHGARFNKKTKNAKLKTSTIDIAMIVLA